MPPYDPFAPRPFSIERLYESAQRLVAPMGRWRRALVDNIGPRAGDVIVELGCGAGALAIALALAEPRAQVIAVDPDEGALSRARTRAVENGAKIEFVRGLGADAAHLLADWAPSKLVANFVERPALAHEKRATIAAAHVALRPDGVLHLADYGIASASAARPAQTQPGATPVDRSATAEREAMLALLRGAGFVAAERTESFPAPRGAVALYRARIS